MFHQILLMVFLGREERRCGGYFRNDRPIEALLPCKEGSRGSLSLLLGMIENGGPVLTSHVRPLAIERGRIMDLPKNLEQAFVGNDSRVEVYLHGFCVAGGSGTYVLVRRINKRSPRVSANCLGYALYLAEEVFYAPETSCCESCDFHS